MDLNTLVKQQIYAGPLSQLPQYEKCIINTINAHSYCEAKKDLLFANALQNGSMLLPDGSGIVLAAWILTGKKIKKIAGADIHDHLLRRANEKGQSVFYLGSSESTLQLIAKRIHVEHPHIRMGSYSPPYKPVFSSEDTAKMIAQVNDFMADILFVGMTAPKQEKWVYEHNEKINASTTVSIGAVFDFYAGTAKRSHPLWIRMGLEWLPRTIREPRLIKRNLISIPKFMLEIICYKIFGKGYLKEEY